MPPPSPGLSPAERAQRNELLLADLYLPPPHVADKSLIFDGLIGCEFIKERLTEYEALLP